MCGFRQVFIITYLSFREVKPRVRGACSFYTLEAVHSFRGEQERIMYDRTDNRGFDWRGFDCTTTSIFIWAERQNAIVECCNMTYLQNPQHSEFWHTKSSFSHALGFGIPVRFFK